MPPNISSIESAVQDISDSGVAFIGLKISFDVSFSLILLKYGIQLHDDVNGGLQDFYCGQIDALSTESVHIQLCVWDTGSMYCPIIEEGKEQ